MKGFTFAKDMIRAFLAIEISEEVRNRLALEVTRLKHSRARVGWVAPENVHLTLAFLGDIFPAQVREVGAALDRVGIETSGFAYSVVGLGYFGAPRSPRVVWAGITEGAEALVSLQKRAGVALRELSFTMEERPFKPHLTLGRVRSSRDAGELATLLDAAGWMPFGSVTVERVVLMRSQLQSEGPAYSVLHAAPLARG